GERLLCTQEVIGSIPIGSIKSRLLDNQKQSALFGYTGINIQNFVKLSQPLSFLYNKDVTGTGKEWGQHEANFNYRGSDGFRANAPRR
ncbi:hypothetical protein, partial [Geobacillus sp. T6]|uniref:hypothetical protein n=1 Tax=Geobacillus sp. T6 TaxID=1659191 RepID=UPI0019D715FB